jgi:hypothetical protein
LDPSILPFVKDWGPTSLLTLLIVLIMLGRLVPRRTMDTQIEAERQKTEIWKEVAETRRQELEVRTQVAPAQLEAAKIVEKVMLELKAQASPEEKI